MVLALPTQNDEALHCWTVMSGLASRRQQSHGRVALQFLVLHCNFVARQFVEEVCDAVL